MFARTDKGIICCCAKDLSSLQEPNTTKKNSRKTQKDMFYKSINLSPYEMESVKVGTKKPFDATMHCIKRRNFYNNIEDKNCICKNAPNTWESSRKLYGNTDNTKMWMDASGDNKDNIKRNIEFCNTSKKHNNLGKHFKKPIELSDSTKQYLGSNSPNQHLNNQLKRIYKGDMCRCCLDHEAALTEGPNTVLCPEGPCAKAANKGITNILCRCKNKNQNLVTKACISLSSTFSKDSVSLKNISNIRNKLFSACHKYSQKAAKRTHNDSLDSEYLYNTDKKSIGQKQKIKDKIIKPENKNDQTGEPFFEVLVNPVNMSVLNPIEIRKNVIKYGRKNDLRCICRSRGPIGTGEVCKAGVCKRAYKNKQTNFNCWCDKGLKECGDTTCNLLTPKNINRNQKTSKHYNTKQPVKTPLLEVQLDMDKMSVVNPKEIENKMINSITVDKTCSSGVCKNSALNKNPYFCKCIGKKLNSEITECTKDTCMSETRDRKFKFCSSCFSIFSKSDNWFRVKNRTKKRRVQRRSFYEFDVNKLRRGRIRPKLDNTLKNDDYHLNNLQQNLNKNYTIKRQTNRYPRIPCYSNKVKHQNHSNLKVKKRYKLRRKKTSAKPRTEKSQQRQLEKDMKRRAKIYKKQEKLAAKQRLRAIKMMKRKLKEQPTETNCFLTILLGLLKITFKTIFTLFRVVFTVIRKPKGSFWYIRDRIKDPEGTCLKIKKWFRDAFLLKKLQAAETVRGSDTLTILSDHLLDSALYQSLAGKGKTRREQMEFEQKAKARKRRIKKRQQQAVFGCKDILLTTLRRTPCLWVYHICPYLYPQCLGLLSFMRNFTHILMFLVAFICWTPCIVSFELCRACLCCFMCTG